MHQESVKSLPFSKYRQPKKESIMKKSLKRIGLIIALAALTTVSIAGARYQKRVTPGGTLRLDSNNNCVCMSPGETSGPPCGGECELNRQGLK